MINTQIISLDGVSIRLKEKHDFEWLRTVGKVDGEAIRKNFRW